MKSHLKSLLAVVTACCFSVAGPWLHADELQIKLPKGFKLTRFADGATKQGKLLSGPRFMTFDADGNLFVSSARGGKVLMLPDANKDGVTDAVVAIAQGQNYPQGLALSVMSCWLPIRMRLSESGVQMALLEIVGLHRSGLSRICLPAGTGQKRSSWGRMAICISMWVQAVMCVSKRTHYAQRYCVTH